MKEKAYLLVSAIIFALIAVLHLIRLVNHWPIQIGTTIVPIWGSWLGLIIAVGLSFWAFQIMHRLRGSH